MGETELKIAGVYRRDRHAGRGDMPTGTKPPRKPAHLKGEAGKLWQSLVPEMVRMGLLSSADTSVLTAACELWALYRGAVVAALADPLDADARRAVVQYLTLWNATAAKLGLNPADRRRIWAASANVAATTPAAIPKVQTRNRA